MKSDAIIESFNVIEDGVTSVSNVGEAMVIDHFVLERAKEGFDKGVIVTVALSTHGSG